uniref:Uncharacterized protein n=1 Tax=Rhizophora mucronata TaxID=61149 RepID=A0A2P2R2Y0_RHIMU
MKTSEKNIIYLSGYFATDSHK